MPPCCSATWRTIARPRPEPGRPRGVGAAVEAVEDVRQVGRAMPGPWSRTRSPPTPARPRRRRRRHARGVVEQVVDRPRQPVGRALDDRRLSSAPNATSGACRRARSIASATSSSRRTSSRSRLRLVPAGELDQVGDERASSSAAPGRRRAAARARSAGSARLGQHLDVGAQRVIGVRSSCEASATSCRCAAIERSSVSSIALNCAASSPTSSWRRRPRSAGRGPRSAAMCCAASVTRAIGATTCATASRPSTAASAIAAQQTSAGAAAAARAPRRSASSERAELDRRPRSSGAVSTRTWCRATSASESSASATPAATRARASSTGSSPRSVPSTRTVAVAGDELDVRRGPPRCAGSADVERPRPRPRRPAVGRRHPLDPLTSPACSQLRGRPAAQLAAHGDVRDAGGEHDGDADRDARPPASSGAAAAASALAARSRRRAPCAAGAARRRPRSFAAGSRCRRRASSSSSRSRSPTRARRSASASAPGAGAPGTARAGGTRSATARAAESPRRAS